VRKTYPLSERLRIAQRFDIGGEAYMVSPYGGGHINDTYAVEAKCSVDGRRAMKRFVLQRINTNVFRDPRQLVNNNIRKVTEKQRAAVADHGGDPSRECLKLVPTDGGDYLLQHEQDASFWRCYDFIEGACTYEFIPDDARGRDLARQAGRTFGEFHLQLDGLSAEDLHETIPQFHHTPHRFEQLEAAVAADAAGRVKDCGPEIEYALSLQSMAPRLIDAMMTGELPVRVCHNDTKINNVMFDFTGPKDRAMTVIDLDTVMAGTMLYDFGDLVRSSTWPGPEDEQDPSNVYVSIDLFAALVEGWLEGAGAIMTKIEIEQMVFAGKLMTYNVGLRFLADYLSGDKYFATQRPGQNLDRARVQFAMIQNMERKSVAMRDIVATSAGTNAA
jgi:aminoglycoside phosphotransferase (APT) family kinase protein